MLSQSLMSQSPGRPRRQNSTPTTATNSPKQKSLDNNEQPPGIHHRGLSFDQTITPRNARILTRQNNGRTNVENLFEQQLSENVMQEAQQQQPMARPGQNTSRENTQIQPTLYSTPAAPRPEHGANNEQIAAMMEIWEDNTIHSFDSNTYNTHSFDPNPSARYLEGFGDGAEGFDTTNLINEMKLFTREEMEGNTNHQGHSLPLSAVMDKSQRPQTPPNQIVRGTFPMTPATTPFSNHNANSQVYDRRHEGSPSRQDPQLTIKASHSMQRGSSYQDNFTAMSKHAMSPVPSPPHTAPVKPRGFIDQADFPDLNMFNMSKLQMDVPSNAGGYDSVNCSPLSKAASSAMSSFQSSPEMAHMNFFDETTFAMHSGAMSSRLSNLTETQSMVDLSSARSSPKKEKKHKRNQSVSDLGDFEEVVEDTGVTTEEISSFITGPDADNKWKCLYTDCGKLFGRKENIKSHVQTHLGDRQFRCKICSKCFVRQHDLKRHAHIHSEERDHMCDCGRGFARQDALTRHRQRGMCIGAFEGATKKVTKRGRPRKTRHESNVNDEKAAKVRQEVLDRLGMGDTSSCASSVSSHPSPPEILDHMSVGAASPSHIHRTLIQTGSNENCLAWDPPQTSPVFGESQTMSPQHSQHSHLNQTVSRAASPLIFPELPMSRQGSGDSSQSRYSALPELELSSSSPAASKIHDFSNSEAGGSSSMTSTQDQAFFDNNFFEKDFNLSLDLPKDATTPTGDFFDLMNLEGGASEANLHKESMKGDNPPMSFATYSDSIMGDVDSFFPGLE